jgi:hypothetical protein
VVSGVLQRVDWKAVSSTTQQRTAEVTDRMRSLAADVDWDRLRPVASKVATALVAAAASGQIGSLSGPAAMAVTRALRTNNVGEAAAALVVSKGAGGVVAGEVIKTFLRPETSARPAAGNHPQIFEARLAELHELTSPINPSDEDR